MKIAVLGRSEILYDTIAQLRRAGHVISCLLTHDGNHYPEHLGPALRPCILWSVMTRIPYLWEDDIACLHVAVSVLEAPLEELVRWSGVKVFDFPPIHVFLNTDELARYERTRSIHHQMERLLVERCEMRGPRDWLGDRLSQAGRPVQLGNPS